MTEQGAQYDHIGSKYDQYVRTATLKRSESYTFFRMVRRARGAGHPPGHLGHGHRRRSTAEAGRAGAGEARRVRYQAAAEATLTALVERYLLRAGDPLPRLLQPADQPGDPARADLGLILSLRGPPRAERRPRAGSGVRASCAPAKSASVRRESRQLS